MFEAQRCSRGFYAASFQSQPFGDLRRDHRTNLARATRWWHKELAGAHTEILEIADRARNGRNTAGSSVCTPLNHRRSP